MIRRVQFVQHRPHRPSLSGSARSRRAAEALHYGDLCDASSINQILERSRPDEIYNLGAQSHVKVSFDIPEYTGDVTGLGVVRMLEAMRELGLKRQASIRRRPPSCTARWSRLRRPRPRRSIRAVPTPPPRPMRSTSRKTTARAYGMFAVNGILFNHESPRRGETFVTRKITPGRRADQARPARKAVSGQSRRPPRLGLCRRLRRGDVADAADRQAERFRHRHRRDRTRSANSATWSSPTSASHSSGTAAEARSAVSGRRDKRSWKSTPTTSGRQRSICSWATRPKPASN